jgi:hypothetical protein
MSEIVNIVNQIESNKNKMDNAADELSEKSGVSDVFQAGGRLYVQISAGNDYLVGSIEDKYDVTVNKVTEAGSKPTPDRPPVQDKEIEFINN